MTDSPEKTEKAASKIEEQEATLFSTTSHTSSHQNDYWWEQEDAGVRRKLDLHIVPL